MQRLIIGGVAAASMLAATSSQAALILDTFSAESVSEVVNLHVPTAALGNTDSVTVTDDLNGVFVPDVFGNERYVEVERVGGAVDALIDLGSGVLDYATSGGISSAMLTLKYDDFTDVDVTEGGMNSVFVLDTIWLQGSATIKVTLSDGANSASVSKPLTSAVNDPVFSLASFAGVDMTSIDSIMIEVDTQQAGTDALFDIALFTVPEPASLALLAIGGTLIAARRRA